MVSVGVAALVRVMVVEMKEKRIRNSEGKWGISEEDCLDQSARRLSRR
jgi:hypothetical protein